MPVYKSTFKATDGLVPVTLAEERLLLTWCEWANVNLHNYNTFTINMVIGALSVGTGYASVTETWNTGKLNRG